MENYNDFLNNQKKINELKEANELLLELRDEIEFNEKYYNILEKKIKENSAFFIKTPTTYFFNKKYKDGVDLNLKGYKSKIEKFHFVFENEEKHIKIIDDTESIYCNNDVDNFEEQIEIMLKMVLSKGWEIDEIQINSEDERFKIEAEKQIQKIKEFKDLKYNNKNKKKLR